MQRLQILPASLALVIISITLLVPPIYVPTKASAAITPEWQVMCSFDHNAKDDPIVFPKQFGASHMHSFYGNTSTNANSTAKSLMASKSNCGRNMESSDRSAYWVPSIFKKQSDGSLKLVANDKQIAFIYYVRAGGASGPKVKPFPIGLRMIAGDMKATTPQSESITYWACGGGGGGPRSGHIPTCNEPGQPIHATLNFPNCWDGKNLDSANHKSHMAYSSQRGVCPASHPVSLPVLTFNLDYYGVPGGSQYVLASGSGRTMHGDFFAAWDQRVQNALVSECLNTPRSCIGIHREGNIIFKPDYDPDPIPNINLSNFSAKSPHVIGAQTSVATIPKSQSQHNHSTHENTNHETTSEKHSVPEKSDAPDALPSTGAASLATGAIGIAAAGLLAYRHWNYLQNYWNSMIRVYRKYFKI